MTNVDELAQLSVALGRVRAAAACLPKEHELPMGCGRTELGEIEDAMSRMLERLQDLADRTQIDVQAGVIE